MRYKVYWHTQPSPASTYYSGVETVHIEDTDEDEDESEAKQFAQFNVWQRAFRDYSRNHIVVTKVEKA